jgi:hypothetical protein
MIKEIKVKHPNGPMRYLAFDAPCTWFEMESEENVQAFTYAVYHEPMSNLYHKEITDGIYIEIMKHQGDKSGRFFFDGHTTRPDKEREQFTIREFFNDFESAKKFAFEYIKTMREICKIDKPKWKLI